MKHIVVPTDFSPTAVKALHYAASLCMRTGAHLHLIHAYTLLENPFVDGKSLRDAWNRQQQEEHTAALLQARQELLEKFAGLQMEIHLFTGPTEDVIVQYCAAHPADMLVMGTQGASGLARVVVGSVTASVIERSLIPVLAIPEQFEGKVPARMLIASRGMEQELDLLKPAMDLARVFDIPVEVLIFADEDLSDLQITVRSGMVESFVRSLRQKYPWANAEATLVEGNDFETSLQDYCGQTGVGIFCMLTRKREGFWEKVLNPSLTKSMAYHTRIPLFAIPMP